MDTQTGEIIQVVETGAHAHSAEASGIVSKIMSQSQVDAENAKRKAEGKGEIVPIAKVPKANCRRCYGRGHLGKDIKSDQFIKCPCVYTEDEAKARRARLAKNELDHLMHGRK